MERSELNLIGEQCLKDMRSIGKFDRELYIYTVQPSTCIYKWQGLSRATAIHIRVHSCSDLTCRCQCIHGGARQANGLQTAISSLLALIRTINEYVWNVFHFHIHGVIINPCANG